MPQKSLSTASSSILALVRSWDKKYPVEPIIIDAPQTYLFLYGEKQFRSALKHRIARDVLAFFERSPAAGALRLRIYERIAQLSSKSHLMSEPAMQAALCEISLLTQVLRAQD